jgi:DNA invertase Pin-like site-specific DNA recombinase
MAAKTDRKNAEETFSPIPGSGGRVIAYLRVSTDRQDMDGQRLAVLDHARQLGLVVSKFIEAEVSSRKNIVERRIDEFMSELVTGDTLICSELSRIGRSLTEVVQTVNQLAARKVRVIAIKQGIDIRDGQQDMSSKVMVAMFSLLAELERDLISERTKMALAARKSSGVRLGRPPGRSSRSKLDGQLDAISELLRHQVSKSAIARMVGTSRSTLDDFIKSRRVVAEKM